MSTGQSSSTFTAGLVQMRSGLSPQANLDAAVKLIGEAKAGGADYVLTPEMTNILELKRERLFAAIVAEESDASLAAFQELARKLGIFLHVGSLAIKLSADKAANRSFLINRHGEIVARYDKIHMFDVDLANGESYRESRNYRPGEIAVVTDLPWGRLGLTVCYDLRFPALYRALAEAGSMLSGHPVGLHPADRRGALARAQSRPRHRERRVRAGGGAGRQARERARDLRPFAGGRPVGPHPGGRRHRAWCRARDDRPGRGRGRARENSLAPAWPAVRDHRADGGAGPSPCGARPGMIRYALACDNGHTFESWFQNSAAYDKQVKRGLIGCPACGSTKVEKALMTPGLSGTRKRGARAPAPAHEAAAPTPETPAAVSEAPAPVAMMSPQEREFRKKLKELREHLTKNADYVGGKFPEEARKMHYGEIEHRSIYGEASPQDAKDLHDEGIEFHPLPVLPDERN